MRRGSAGARRALLSALLALPACRADRDAPAQMQPPQMEVRSGERFSIRLDSNATTGYRWQLATAPDPAIAMLVSSEYEAGDTQSAGAGGEEAWTFVARGAGRTSIVLEYARPWEHGQPPARTHAVVVNVRAP